MVRDSGAPGAVALVRTPSGTWQGAAGLSDLTTRTAMRPDDRFRVASLTKTFVATVVLQLVAEGRLRLDDPVARWFPRLVPQASKITVRDLLNHTSGLYDFLSDKRVVKRASEDPVVVISPRQLVTFSASHPLLFRPGTSWSYSNTNYILLGQIVEKVTGHNIQQELERRIFRPLGLTKTSFADGPVEGEQRLAHGYSLGAGKPRDATDNWSGMVWTAGAIVSDTRDLARFFGALLGGYLLHRDLLRTMEKTVPDSQGGAYGLGLTNFPIICGKAWGHAGELPGYQSLVLASGDGRHIAVIAANGGSTPQGGFRVFQTTGLFYCWT
jgi:D-alanyl-D-alanine carboxypeptidase